jgi:hypothetical protein
LRPATATDASRSGRLWNDNRDAAAAFLALLAHGARITPPGRRRAGELAEAMGATCAWREDEDGVWHTACGEAHVFNDGGPRENRHAFCPYCGGGLEGEE